MSNWTVSETERFRNRKKRLRRANCRSRNPSFDGGKKSERKKTYWENVQNREEDRIEKHEHQNDYRDDWMVLEDAVYSVKRRRVNIFIYYATLEIKNKTKIDIYILINRIEMGNAESKIAAMIKIVKYFFFVMKISIRLTTL